MLLLSKGKNKQVIVMLSKKTQICNIQILSKLENITKNTYQSSIAPSVAVTPFSSDVQFSYHTYHICGFT